MEHPYINSPYVLKVTVALLRDHYKMAASEPTSLSYVHMDFISTSHPVRYFSWHFVFFYTRPPNLAPAVTSLRISQLILLCAIGTKSTYAEAIDSKVPTIVEVAIPIVVYCRRLPE